MYSAKYMHLQYSIQYPTCYPYLSYIEHIVSDDYCPSKSTQWTAFRTRHIDSTCANYSAIALILVNSSRLYKVLFYFHPCKYITMDIKVSYCII